MNLSGPIARFALALTARHFVVGIMSANWTTQSSNLVPTHCAVDEPVVRVVARFVPVAAAIGAPNKAFEFTIHSASLPS